MTYLAEAYLMGAGLAHLSKDHLTIGYPRTATFKRYGVLGPVLPSGKQVLPFSFDHGNDIREERDKPL